MIIQTLQNKGLSYNYSDIVLAQVDEYAVIELSYNGNILFYERYLPDVNGVVRVKNLGKLAEEVYDFQQFELDLVPMQTKGEAVRFYIKIFDKDGNVVIDTSVLIYICKSIFNDLSYQNITVVPLTRANHKIITPKNTEVLCYYYGVPLKAEVVYMYQNAKFEKTVTITTTPPYPDLNREIFECYRVSYYDIALLLLLQYGINPNQIKILHYDIFGENNENFRIHHEVSQKTFPHHKTFLFWNSFYAIESFTTYDAEKEVNKWERDYSEINNKSLLVSGKLDKTFTVTSGFINRKQLNVLEDLLDSKEIVVMEEDYTMIPVVIDSEKFEVTEYKNEIVSVEFSYKYTDTNHLRTKFEPFKKLIPMRIFDDTFDDTFN